MKIFYRILLATSLASPLAAPYLLSSSPSFQAQTAEVKQIIARNQYRGIAVGAFFVIGTSISCLALYGKSDQAKVDFTEEGMKSLTPSQKRAVAEELIAAAEKEEALAAFSNEWDNLGK